METLADLPQSCRIHEVIRGALPEIEKQIAARKLADTSVGFRAYCEGELARHVKNVGDMAKNLAHPTLYSEAERPQMLELKLWNLTLCGLYKSELASLDTDKTAQTQAIQPAVTNSADTWAGLLRPGVRFTLADLDQLLVNVTLLNDTTSRIPTPDFRGTAVVGVVSALRERRYLLNGNNAKLAGVLAERYGQDVANPHTVSRNYDPLPNQAQRVYTRALALLPAP